MSNEDCQQDVDTKYLKENIYKTLKYYTWKLHSLLYHHISAWVDNKNWIEPKAIDQNGKKRNNFKSLAFYVKNISDNM